MAERANATIVEVPASHVSFVSQPEAATQLILQAVESLADDILLAHSLGVHMCSASPFVPTAGTPLAVAAPGSISRTLNVMAAMRIANPDWLIPTVSALEQQAGGGQCAGLRAGANVITVNFTPADQRNRYLIYGATRHIVGHEQVRRQLESEGLVPGGSVWVNASTTVD
jgi:biotin synthase